MRPKAPMNRLKGDRSPYFTTIRHKINGMNRAERREWFRECLDSAEKDTELWSWINWVSKSHGKYKGGKYLKKGRPRSWIQDHPDTRNGGYE